MSQASTLQANNSQLQKLINAKNHADPSIKALVKKNKIIIFSQDDLANAPEQFLVQARKFAELNLLLALGNNNTNDFESAIDNVKFFYENTLNSSKSSEFFMVTSIHLLFLLSAHRNQQFYAKIQTLHSSDLKDKHISYVLLLNDAIEEGNYRRVFQLKKESPLIYFSAFLNRISETVRFQIAKSAEKAYTQLSISEALKIFQLDNQAELKNFIDKYCEEIQEKMINWVFNNGKIFFEKTNKRLVVFNSNDLISTTLNYAHQLEKIA